VRTGFRENDGRIFRHEWHEFARKQQNNSPNSCYSWQNEKVSGSKATLLDKDNRQRREPKMRPVPLVLIAILTIPAVIGCGAPTPAPTPDVDATVAAALAATNTAQAAFQQTVDAAVQATGAAAPTPAAPATPDTQATIEAAVRATLAAAPTPTPAVQYVTLSEEELAALVEAAVAEATASSADSSAAVTTATSDDTLTAAEVAALLAAVDETAALVSYAEDLLTAYMSLYGELAYEALAVLQAMEEDLAIIAANTAAMAATLAEIDATLQQGLTLAEETIVQLEGAAQAAAQKALQLQTQAQNWLAQLPAAQERRAMAVLSVQPNKAPADRMAALQSAFAYVDGVRQSLGDNVLTAAELADIVQLGANASAGLKSQGGPALQGLGGQIDDITASLARGQIPQAQLGLGPLETALGARPGRP